MYFLEFWIIQMVTYLKNMLTITKDYVFHNLQAQYQLKTVYHTKFDEQTVPLTMLALDLMRSINEFLLFIYCCHLKLYLSTKHEVYGGKKIMACKFEEGFPTWFNKQELGGASCFTRK